ncbi:Transcriptional regulator/sugar kinase [Rubrobacter radiotolerans]|uniref:ROK family protein n=1 Tax=Rubrobacter radiotolerans TaxID=42256 RepID=A0A023X359_RUBRA|nr:ROK family protein [Rubrobacter radiotolerans]AHY46445.1 Transcriptional regulator/sugar kinase [Rubrobacter radiotolerans]MDX5893852.1 ROK family protein [Rubrobacter radiotolerans]SMC04619.1 polyphosphate glucokinase [Rubrobacter radiotolerans DSM 5868]
MEVFGLDIGGSGIKGAPVDTQTGELTSERVRIKTPRPSTPEAIAETCVAVVRESGWEGPIGCGFPAVIKEGVIQTAANVDDANIGFDLRGALQDALGSEVFLVNDADAAGMAEIKWGAGRDVPGVVIMVTLGTGLGTALFVDGKLVPNTELGHIEVRGKDAEWRASDSARKRENLGWKKYGQRLDEYLNRMDALFWPDRFILGGGISKKADKFLPEVSTRAEVVTAEMHNEAGIAGAALASVSQAERLPNATGRAAS